MPTHHYTHPTNTPHYINPTHTISKISRKEWHITSPNAPTTVHPTYTAAKAYAATQTYLPEQQPELHTPPHPEPEQTRTVEAINALFAVAAQLPDPTGCIALAIRNTDAVAVCGHLADADSEAAGVALDNIRAHVSGLGPTPIRIAEVLPSLHTVSFSAQPFSFSAQPYCLGVMLDELIDMEGDIAHAVCKWVAQSLITGENSWVGRLMIESAVMKGCNGGWMRREDEAIQSIRRYLAVGDWRALEMVKDVIDGMIEREDARCAAGEKGAEVTPSLAGEGVGREAQEGEDEMSYDTARELTAWGRVWRWAAREDGEEVMRGTLTGEGVWGEGDPALLLPEPEHRIPMPSGDGHLIVNWSEDKRPDGSIWGQACVWLDDASGLSLLANWTPHSGLGWKASDTRGVDMRALDRLLDVINEAGLAIAQ